MLFEYLRSLPSCSNSSFSCSLPSISLAPVQVVPLFLIHRAKRPSLCNNLPCNHTHLSNIPPAPQRQSAHQEEASLLPCSLSLVDLFDFYLHNHHNTPTNFPHWRPQLERPTLCNNKSIINNRVNKEYQEKNKDTKATRTHRNSDSGPQVAVTHIGLCSPSGTLSSFTGSTLAVDPHSSVLLPLVPVKSATLPLLTSFTIP